MYFVYILANSRRTVLYIGVTNNLKRRLYEHTQHLVRGFTYQYNCSELVYYEQIESIEVAINREKQLKKWSRIKKICLIESFNPEQRDLSASVEMT